MNPNFGFSKMKIPVMVKMKNNVLNLLIFHAYIQLEHL